MMPTHAKPSCRRRWVEQHSPVYKTHLMPSFTLGTASGTHAQHATLALASLAFPTNQPELRGFMSRERIVSSLTISTQTLLWPSYMNPTMSPNHAMQLQAPRVMLAATDPQTHRQPASRAPLVADLLFVRRNAVADPHDAKDAVVALAELPTPTAWS